MGYFLWAIILFALIFWIKQVCSQSSAVDSEAFDDQYGGCTEEMERNVTFFLLNKEKNGDKEFAKVWEASAEAWREIKLRGISLPDGFQDNYGIALVAYINSKNTFLNRFKDSMAKYNRKTFRYHSMHFLLTRAAHLLGTSCWRRPCVVYRRVCVEDLNLGFTGQEVRFGIFKSSYKNRAAAKTTGAMYTITSGFAVDVTAFSLEPDEEVFLIPPDEVYKIRYYGDGDKNTWALKTTGTRCHFYNCDYLYPGGKYDACVPTGGARMVSSMAVVTFLLCGGLFLVTEFIAMC